MNKLMWILWPLLLGARRRFERADMLPAAPRLALAVLLLPFTAAAQDAAHGRMLYETYCGICHYERVHERLKSDVKDLAGLRDTVARWAPRTKRTFTLDELEDVVAYLNESHYRFGLPAPRKAPAAPVK